MQNYLGNSLQRHHYPYLSAMPSLCDNTFNDAFPIINGPIVGPSTIIIATRNGTINGYNAEISGDSILVVDNCESNTVYTGLEIVDTIIYATDFYNGVIDVYDENFIKLKTYP